MKIRMLNSYFRFIRVRFKEPTREQGGFFRTSIALPNREAFGDKPINPAGYSNSHKHVVPF